MAPSIPSRIRGTRRTPGFSRGRAACDGPGRPALGSSAIPVAVVAGVCDPGLAGPGLTEAGYKEWRVHHRLYDSRLLPILPDVWRQETGVGESKAMGNSEFEQLIHDYARRIADQSEEAKLIKSVPWYLGSPLELADLLRGLQLEASRFCELPHQSRFSLIAPLLNTPPRFLNDLILSVRCQSWFRWELILIDDGSDRREHLPVAARWAEEDDRIRFLTMDRRRGRVAAKNAALEAAAGDFVCMLDDTALLHPSAPGHVPPVERRE